MTYKITIEVINILGSGKCSMGQEVGKVYNYPEDRGEMCPSSFHNMYPWILVMQSGGNLYFEGDSVTLGCGDYKHQVVYRITRTLVEEEKSRD